VSGAEVWLLFGANCAGKSTLARALAGSLPRCAHIEVDALRYLVVGGLVAASAGTPPHLAPEEYDRQCRLGDDNAARLARGFAEHGFASVIEGLDDHCAPGSGWAGRALHGLRVRHVLVTCDPAVLARRWRERCGGDWPEDARAQAAAFAAQAPRYDAVVDSAGATPEALAARLASA
jgi:chloramphenicol 3-O-phosphotransferase